MTISELMRRRRALELELFTAAAVWRASRGTVTEPDTAKNLARVTGELIQAAQELDDAMTARLKELQS